MMAGATRPMRLHFFRSLTFLAALVFAVLSSGYAPAAAKSKAPAAKTAAEARGKAGAAPIQPIIGPIDTQARHAYVLEAETGAVLLDKGGEERIPTASLSK